MDHPADETDPPLDPAGVDRLVRNHREFLDFLQRRVGSRELAEDLLQSAFVRAVQKGATVRNDESITAWFYRVLRNAVIDHWRRRGPAERALAGLAAEMEGAQAPPEEWRQAACRCVLDLAETLKPEYAEALRRIEVDGLPVNRYAGEAGLTPGHAAVRVFRARQALRRRIDASCGTCAEHGCLDCDCGK